MPLYNSAPIDSSWKLTFDDEFNSLNTGTWGTNWLGNPGTITKPINSAEQAAYDPAQVSVSGGYLRLGTAYKDVTVAGTHYDMVAGMVQSDNRFEQTYGYFEARIYLPGSNGQIQNWPAFWLNGENWPTDGELDIMEGLSGKAGWHFHSPSGGPGETEAGNYTGWHTYGALWEPGKVTYYYDGVEVGEISTGITSSPMYLILNNGISDSLGGPTAVGSTMLVDWVHVYSGSPTAVAVAPQANYSGPGGGGETAPPPANDEILGTALANLLVGDGAANIIYAYAGNDTLDGVSGSDTLYGGAGNDIFYVDNLADVVCESGTGSDTVRSTVSFDLNADSSSVFGSIENLRLNGTAVTGTGNSLDNVIFGNNSANRLYGNGGKDVITGGGGNDTMTGGSGSDTFCRYALSSEGKDTISDFKTGRGGDVLDIDGILTGYKSGTSNVNDFVRITESGGNTTVQIDANGAAGGHSFTSAVVLAGVTGTSVNQLFNDGNLDLA